MTSTKRTCLATICAMALSLARTSALVDMRTANYSDTWVDIEVESSGRTTALERTYNSRSLFNGIFGFGWCSDYETSIKAYRDGSATVTQCGAGYEDVFTPPGYSAASITAMVDELVSRHRKVLTWRDEGYFSALADGLRKSDRMRRRRADELKLWRPHADGSTFPGGGSAWRLGVAGNAYVLTGPGGVEQRYSKDGRLQATRSRNGIWTTLAYSGNAIQTVSSEISSFEFTVGPDGKVKVVKGSNGKSTSYEHDSKGRLTRVTNGWGNTYHYEYNDYSNLTRIRYPDNTTKELVYDDEKDWVVEFKERDNCREKYSFSTIDPSTYTAAVTKTCDGNKVTNRSLYEFWYAPRPHGGSYMSRVRTTVNKDVTDITYHPVWGRPQLIIRGNAREEYTYDDGGRLIRKRLPKGTASYEYDDRCNQVSRTSEGTRETWYRYDDRCNLVLARDSSGARVEIAHDSGTGRATARDQNGEAVSLVRYPQGALVLAPSEKKLNKGATRVMELLRRGAPVSEDADTLGWVK